MPISLFNNSSWIKQSNKQTSVNVIAFGGAFIQGSTQIAGNNATVIQVTGVA